MFKQPQIDFLEKLRGSSALFIVEGKKDAEALSSLGIDKTFRISGRSIDTAAEDIVNELKPESVIILTDFDREGKRKAEKLETFLRFSGIKIETRVRKIFKNIMRVTEIEELKGAGVLLNIPYMKELNRDAYSKRMKLR